MNEYIDQFLPCEKSLFLALNGSDSLFWDNIMWTYTSILTWIPMFLFIIYILFRKQKIKEAILVIGALALVILLADQSSSSFFKPFFKRFRPTHHPDYMYLVDTVRNYKGGQYGFISGHATNSFGLAVFLSFLLRCRLFTATILFWAILNSYSRIYLGVHFISDILAGLVWGVLIGFLVYRTYAFVRKKYYKTPRYRLYNTYPQSKGNILAIGITSYILLILILSPLLTYIIKII